MTMVKSEVQVILALNISRINIAIYRNKLRKIANKDWQTKHLYLLFSHFKHFIRVVSSQEFPSVILLFQKETKLKRFEIHQNAKAIRSA